MSNNKLSSNSNNRKSKLTYKGQSTWICQETGEVRTIDEFERSSGRNEPFMITYLAEIINLIDSLGNKKMQVVKYILKYMEKSNNTLIITTTELAEKSKVSRQIVSDTLKILENAGIVWFENLSPAIVEINDIKIGLIGLYDLDGSAESVLQKTMENAVVKAWRFQIF